MIRLFSFKGFVVFVVLISTLARDSASILNNITPFPESRPDHRVLIVTTSKDEDDKHCDTHCSLREATDQAQSGDVIEFSPTIEGMIEIKDQISIFKKYIEIRSAISNPEHLVFTSEVGSVFFIHPEAGLRLSYIVISNGDVAIDNFGLLDVNHCSFEKQKYFAVGNWYAESEIKNSTFLGAGVLNEHSSLNIINSTFRYTQFRGAISNNGNTTIINSTFVNTKERIGNGFINTVPPSVNSKLILANSIIYDPIGGIPCSNGIYDLGGNIQYPIKYSSDTCGTSIPRIDPLLMPISDNGGATWTIGLQPDSPAGGHGIATICKAFASNDQRGVDRFANGDKQCNSGAYED